jgi:hypothetical protein
MRRDDERDDRDEPSQPRGQTLDDIRRALREEYQQTVAELGEGRRRVPLDDDDYDDDDDEFETRRRKRKANRDPHAWYHPALWPVVAAVVMVLAFALGYVTGSGPARLARETVADGRDAAASIPSASPPMAEERGAPASAPSETAGTVAPAPAAGEAPPQEASARREATARPDADERSAANDRQQADERQPAKPRQEANPRQEATARPVAKPRQDAKAADGEARAERAELPPAEPKRSTERVRRDPTPPADTESRDRRRETVASVAPATRGGGTAADSTAEERDLPPRPASQQPVARADDTRVTRTDDTRDRDGRGSGTPSGVALRIAVSEWIVAHRMEDLDRLMGLYAPKLAVFGDGHDVARDAVRRDKQRAFAANERLVSAEPTVTLGAGERTASSRVRLRYVTRGSRPASGDVVRELGWVWTPGGWKIESERDVAVLR